MFLIFSHLKDYVNKINFFKNYMFQGIVIHELANPECSILYHRKRNNLA